MMRGQAAAGEIHIEVHDPSGAAIAAAIKIAGPGVAERAYQTDPLGKIVFPNLSPGRYRVEITKEGFATQVVDFDLKSGAAVSRSITLPLATQAARVDVVGATPLPGTDTPIDDIPAPVQTASSLDLEQTGSLNLSDLM